MAPITNINIEYAAKSKDEIIPPLYALKYRKHFNAKTIIKPTIITTGNPPKTIPKKYGLQDMIIKIHV